MDRFTFSELAIFTAGEDSRRWDQFRAARMVAATIAQVNAKKGHRVNAQKIWPLPGDNDKPNGDKPNLTASEFTDICGRLGLSMDKIQS